MAEAVNGSNRLLEAKRSRVRQLVTYWVIAAYLGLAGLVVVWLLWAGRYDLAVGVLSGVAGLAGSIAGFWFGSRGASKERDTQEESPNDEVPGDEEAEEEEEAERADV